MPTPLLLAAAAISLAPLPGCQPPAPAPAQPPKGPAVTAAAPAWPEEAPYLTGHTQLTLPADFARAGEAYFDHNSPPKAIVFQAIARPGEQTMPDRPGSHYAMYASTLSTGLSSGPALTSRVLLSPPGSANTCGWFHPTQPNTVVFGSTLIAPAASDPNGYSRDRSRYTWQFQREMEVVTASPLSMKPPQKLFSRDGYDAEGSFSKDGRFYLYTHVDPESRDPDIWVYDRTTDHHTALITAKGYDGGPFFSPDGKWICYRSDRKGNNELQLFIAELEFAEHKDGTRIRGIKREIQLTDQDGIVNWCPYWHPSGKYLVYASSAAGGHQNYEVLAIEVDPSKPADKLRLARITNSAGFDGLPVFSADGAFMMWTSQRGPRFEDEARPSSQLWIARVNGEPAWGYVPPAPAPTPPLAPENKP